MARPRPRRAFDSVPRRLARRRRVRGGVFVTLIVLGASALLDRGGAFRYSGDDWAAFDQKRFVVTHVADGDTLTVRPPDGGAETRVRLIGVDTPELRPQHGGRPDHWAAEAKRYADGRAAGRAVTLRLEPTRTRDRYGRLLAYVYLGDAADHLNLSLVRDGHAYADRRFAHSLKSQFEQAEAEARGRSRGLWRDLRDEQMPEWRQRWLRDRRDAD